MEIHSELAEKFEFENNKIFIEFNEKLINLFKDLGCAYLKAGEDFKVCQYDPEDDYDPSDDIYRSYIDPVYDRIVSTINNFCKILGVNKKIDESLFRMYLENCDPDYRYLIDQNLLFDEEFVCNLTKNLIRRIFQSKIEVMNTFYHYSSRVDQNYRYLDPDIGV